MSEPTSEIPTAIDPDLDAGARVGEYEVESKIGQGAFGTVYKATHPLIGKVVAIKVLARKFSVDPEMVSRFTAEARAVNQIRNRHIIDIFSFGALDDGRQYYVMEYLDGEPLDALLDRGRIPVADTLQILRGVARALDAAHGKGVAHRDLKAENIFLANDAEGSATGYWPKLLDFGIAKLMAPEDGLKHKTRTGAPIGTPYYMSPEQCRGKDVDHRTDIYAFGVLAYLMLTGVYPFDADDYMSILMKQITERPSAPSTHNAELTPDIDDAVAWMMNKDPADRPPDLRTAVRALEQAAVAAGLATPTQWELQTGPIAIPTQAINVASAGLGRMSSRGAASGNPVGDVSVPARRRSAAAWIAAGTGALLVAGLVAMLAIERGAPTSEPAPRSTQHQVVPPAPAPAPAPAPEVEVPQTVIVTVSGVPEGTEVFAGGMTVGAAPGPVQLPRDAAAMVLTFKADGFLTASREITPDRDQALEVTLKKKPTTGKRPTKDDILDPFGRKR